MSLSEVAFYGTTTSKIQTMKVERLVNKQPVKNLLDSGSTHNFIDSRLVKQLGWQPQHTKSFDVMIANGEKSKKSGLLQECILGN